MEPSLQEAGPPPYACAVAASRAAESPGWEGRERWAGREPTWRRRSATLKARAALSAGFGSGSVWRGGRGETRGAYGAGSTGAPQLRGGERPDVPGRAGESRPPGLPSLGGGVPPARPVAASPCADCLAGPGSRPPRPSLPAFLRSRGPRSAPAAASPFALLGALCPFPPFPALRAAFLSGYLSSLGSRLLPRPPRRCSTPASSPGPWLAGRPGPKP